VSNWQCSGDERVTTADLVAASPLIVIAVSAIVVLLVGAFRRNHLAVAAVTLLGHGAAFASLAAAATTVPRQITALLIIDGYGLLYVALLLAASFVVSVLAYGYLNGRADHVEEFYVLQLLATLGAVVLVLSRHFVALFLGLELLSVALYAMIAYLRTDERPLEAGIKYLFLAGASSAFLLFGMALLYAELGTMAFDRMGRLLAAGENIRSVLVLTGLAMTITGIGFKLAVVPFQMWTPDVYEGAPAPVTAFIATVSKGAVVGLLLRYFVQTGAYPYHSLMLVFGLIAGASMVVGNLLALLQSNVKRILAYSSIAHLGYLLVAFVAGGPRGVEAVTFYLTAYVVTTLGAFGIVTVLSAKEQDADSLDAYRGLFWRRPGLAMTFTASLLSLAGIPLTAGFMGKIYVLMAGVQSALWPLVVLLVFTSAISLVYYLRIVVAMYTALPQPEAARAHPSIPSSSLAGSVILVTLTLGLVWLGIYPAPLIRAIRLTVASLL
jgi:NADH-quinone oxidoreductase subunit N